MVVVVVVVVVVDVPVVVVDVPVVVDVLVVDVFVEVAVVSVVVVGSVGGTPESWVPLSPLPQAETANSKPIQSILSIVLIL